MNNLKQKVGNFLVYQVNMKTMVLQQTTYKDFVKQLKQLNVNKSKMNIVEKQIQKKKKNLMRKEMKKFQESTQQNDNWKRHYW